MTFPSQLPQLLNFYVELNFGTNRCRAKMSRRCTQISVGWVEGRTVPPRGVDPDWRAVKRQGEALSTVDHFITLQTGVLGKVYSKSPLTVT